MSYLLIDEKENIWSCKLEDLTIGLAESFIHQFKGDKLGTLTLFYDSINDRVVLNSDNPNYAYNLKLVTNYLKATKTKRADFRANNKTFKEEVYILDGVLLIRKKY